MGIEVGGNDGSTLIEGVGNGVGDSCIEGEADGASEVEIEDVGGGDGFEVVFLVGDALEICFGLDVL